MTTEPPTPPNPVAAATPAPSTPIAAAVADLEVRIGKRKDELVAKLTELQSDAQIAAVEARDKIKARLSQLAHLVKEGVVDGWANISDATRTKLDRWLDS